jgi:glucokinase
VATALVTTTGKIVLRQQEPTSQAGPEAGIAQIIRLLRALLAQSDLRPSDIYGIGVGIPAVLELETDHVIWAPNLTGWRSVALRPALQSQLELPVYIEYDGHTAVLGEWWVGAGQGYMSVVDVIIGTGIGGGMILDGRLYRGRDRLAGAVGWFAMTSEADWIDQRGRAIGHWESLAAGPGIAHLARTLLADYPDTRLSEIGSIESLTAKHIFKAAREDDPLAQQVVTQTACLIGLGVANIVSLVNPEIVILGGSIGAQGDLLLARVQETVQCWAQPISASSVLIVSSPLGSDAGLLGAAYAALLRGEAH